MKIELKILDKKFYNNLPGTGYNPVLPDYATVGSAAIDLVATKDYRILPGAQVMIPTGLSIWVGSHVWESWTEFTNIAGLILPRSGLGTRGLVLANTIGLLDEDFQGEIIVQAWNRLDPMVGLKDNSFHIKAGDHFAQLVFIPIVKPTFTVVSEFSKTTTRGIGGFGSTGS